MCPRCEAGAYLTGDDWLIVRFYQSVSDQWDNVAPMGVEKGPLPVFLRLEALRAELEIRDVPRHLWGWYTDGARLIHRLVHQLDRVDWHGDVPLFDASLAVFCD